MRRARCGRMARARISVSVHLRARAPRRMRDRAKKRTLQSITRSIRRAIAQRASVASASANETGSHSSRRTMGRAAHPEATPAPPRLALPAPRTQSEGQAAWPAPRRETRFAVCLYTFFSMMVLMTSDARSHASQHASMLSNSFDHTSTRMGFSRSSTCSWRMTLM